jgi:ACS family hexuronate transporter-like MFS transporter
MLFTGSSLGAMVAAPLAIHLTARYGFRFAFVGTALVGTLWIPFWLLMTRGDRIPPEAPPAEAATAPIAPDASRWADLARSPTVLRTVVAILGAAPALMFVQNWGSQYLVERWLLPKAGISGYLVIPPLLFDLGAVGFGWYASTREVSGRHFEERRTHVDLMLLGAALAATLALTPLAPTPLVAMLGFGLAAAGVGGLNVLITSDLLSRVPIQQTSAAGGLAAAAQSLAHIVASPLIGLAIDRTHGYGLVSVTLGLAVVPTTLAFVLWPSLRKR